MRHDAVDVTGGCFPPDLFEKIGTQILNVEVTRRTESLLFSEGRSRTLIGGPLGAFLPTTNCSIEGGLVLELCQLRKITQLEPIPVSIEIPFREIDLEIISNEHRNTHFAQRPLILRTVLEST